MAKKKSKKSKRDDDLFSKLRKQGVRKSAADQISKAAKAADSGKGKAGEVLEKAVSDLRSLASDIEGRIPGRAKAETSSRAASTKATATRAKRTTKATARSAKSGAKRTASTAKRSAKSTTGTAKRTAKTRTAADRSAAAKKAAATRKRNAAKRSSAAKKAASTRRSG
jgi:hypothetical protein